MAETEITITVSMLFDSEFESTIYTDDKSPMLTFIPLKGWGYYPAILDAGG